MWLIVIIDYSGSLFGGVVSMLVLHNHYYGWGPQPDIVIIILVLLFRG